MELSSSRRRVVAKILINFSGIIFALVVVGPFISKDAFDLLKFSIGLFLLLLSFVLAIVIEPEDEKKEE